MTTKQANPIPAPAGNPPAGAGSFSTDSFRDFKPPSAVAPRFAAIADPKTHLEAIRSPETFRSHTTTYAAAPLTPDAYKALVTRLNATYDSNAAYRKQQTEYAQKLKDYYQSRTPPRPATLQHTPFGAAPPATPAPTPPPEPVKPQDYIDDDAAFSRLSTYREFVANDPRFVESVPYTAAAWKHYAADPELTRTTAARDAARAYFQRIYSKDYKPPEGVTDYESYDAFAAAHPELGVPEVLPAEWYSAARRAAQGAYKRGLPLTPADTRSYLRRVYEGIASKVVNPSGPVRMDQEHQLVGDDPDAKLYAALTSASPEHLRQAYAFAKSVDRGEQLPDVKAPIDPVAVRRWAADAAVKEFEAVRQATTTELAKPDLDETRRAQLTKQLSALRESTAAKLHAARAANDGGKAFDTLAASVYPATFGQTLDQTPFAIRRFADGSTGVGLKDKIGDVSPVERAIAAALAAQAKVDVTRDWDNSEVVTGSHARPFLNLPADEAGLLRQYVATAHRPLGDITSSVTSGPTGALRPLQFAHHSVFKQNIPGLDSLGVKVTPFDAAMIASIPSAATRLGAAALTRNLTAAQRAAATATALPSAGLGANALVDTAAQSFASPETARRVAETRHKTDMMLMPLMLTSMIPRVGQLAASVGKEAPKYLEAASSPLTTARDAVLNLPDAAAARFPWLKQIGTSSPVQAATRAEAFATNPATFIATEVGAPRLAARLATEGTDTPSVARTMLPEVPAALPSADAVATAPPMAPAATPGAPGAAPAAPAARPSSETVAAAVRTGNWRDLVPYLLVTSPLLAYTLLNSDDDEDDSALGKLLPLAAFLGGGYYLSGGRALDPAYWSNAPAPTS